VPTERVWTNSVFGRIIATIGGAFIAIIPIVGGFGSDAGGGGHRTAAAVGEALIVAAGVALVVAVRTSRLALSDGVLTARNFFISRSMPIVDVVAAHPVGIPWLGITIRARTGRGIRTLVSGSSYTGWGARAEGIAEEIVALAEAARTGVSAPQPLPGGAHRASAEPRRLY
jgi:hypothetical protein